MVRIINGLHRRRLSPVMLTLVCVNAFVVQLHLLVWALGVRSQTEHSICYLCAVSLSLWIALVGTKNQFIMEFKQSTCLCWLFLPGELRQSHVKSLEVLADAIMPRLRPVMDEMATVRGWLLYDGACLYANGFAHCWSWIKWPHGACVDGFYMMGRACMRML